MSILPPYRCLATVLLFASVQPACSDPTPSPQWLVSTVDEPAGAMCAAGGVAIHSGADDDGSGELSADEIAATAYVCADPGGH